MYVPRRTSYGVYISQFFRYARASSNVSDFSCRNKALLPISLSRAIRIISYVSDFSTFYRRHSELVETYNVSLRKFLQEGISEPEYYGDLVNRIRQIVGKFNFSVQFRKGINRYKR